MIQEVPYGTYIEMQNYPNNLNNLDNLIESIDSNDLPISTAIIPNQTHKVIEIAVVYNKGISCICQIIIIMILILPITLVLISIIVPIRMH